MTTASIKTTAELAAESESRKEDSVANIAVTEQSRSQQPEVPKESLTTAKTRKPKSPPPPINETELNEFIAKIDTLSFKNTTKLVTYQGELNRFKKRAQAGEKDFIDSLSATEAKLIVLLEKNQVHQDKLYTTTKALLEELTSALADGRSADALTTWDKIQGNISNTQGKSRDELSSAANQSKDAINELREWKIFAATEQKKQLVEQMRHLAESKMHASDRSKHIASMHGQWKALGWSNQNEELWTQFKTLSDLAYEPCKEYFKQRKQLMAENLKKRREICDQLEQDMAPIENAEININEITKLLSSTEALWKKYAPVEQAKINKLQKRFYGLINTLRKIRRNAVKANAKAKQECITKATALTLLDDKQQAMADAKALQTQWKKIGPTSFKDDKKYWDEFRAACDKVFEHKNNESEQLKTELKQAEIKLKEILAAINQLLDLEEDAFRNCRGQYQELLQRFSAELDPRLKSERKRLLEQLNSYKRKIDMRFKSLPDKKLLQLIANIEKKAALVETFETELSAAQSDEEFTIRQGQVDTEQWQSLGSVGRPELDEMLDRRWAALNKLKSKAEFEKLVAKTTKELRDICIDLEIRANIESPASDSSSRMEFQLMQLKNGFGKAKPDRAENSKFAKSIELHLTCIGPVDKVDRDKYAGRAASAIEKLK